MKSKLIFILTILLVTSCSPYKSSTTTSLRSDLRNYKYVVFGEDDSEGDDVLNDIMLKVENEISKYFEVVSSQKALYLVNENVLVVSPKIHVQTQYWDGGHTYITITFYDFCTKKMIAVVKSSGNGMSISQDQKLATYAIRKELKKTMR